MNRTSGARNPGVPARSALTFPDGCCLLFFNNLLSFEVLFIRCCLIELDDDETDGLIFSVSPLLLLAVPLSIFITFEPSHLQFFCVTVAHLCPQVPAKGS